MIQGTTRRSVEDIASAGGIVADIAKIAETVAEAVDEQSAATMSIARSASSAATNASTVADALKMVEDTIRRTQGAAKFVLELSGDLSVRQGELDVAVERLRGPQSGGCEEVGLGPGRRTRTRHFSRLAR